MFVLGILILGVFVSKVFISADLIYKVVEIDGDNINEEMALSQSDMILVLMQVAVVEFGILYLNTVIFFVQPY